MIWLVLGIAISIPLLVVLACVLFYFNLRTRYLGFLVRIFLEKPLFIAPKGSPTDDADDVSFTTPDGLTLRGSYFHHRGRNRRGVILFGLEYGSNRWSSVPYCEHLVENGFDVFAYEFRSQGDSDPHPGYEPTQWVTDYEVVDTQAAIEYLRNRPDASSEGIGFFGISKGGSAGLIAAAHNPYVRCFVTDGVFATRTTMVPYMQKWVQIVSQRRLLQKILPDWFYRTLANAGLRRVHRETGCTFPHLERLMSKLSPRPLLMIHGERDNYIKPSMAKDLYSRARTPKELWVVKGAKHNKALEVANEEYREKTLGFFKAHLAPADRRRTRVLSAVS